MPIIRLLDSFPRLTSLNPGHPSHSLEINHHNRIVASDKDILASDISMANSPGMNLLESLDHVLRNLGIVLDLVQHWTLVSAVKRTLVPR